MSVGRVMFSLEGWFKGILKGSWKFCRGIGVMGRRSEVFWMELREEGEKIREVEAKKFFFDLVFKWGAIYCSK